MSLRPKFKASDIISKSKLDFKCILNWFDFVLLIKWVWWSVDKQIVGCRGMIYVSSVNAFKH